MNIPVWASTDAVVTYPAEMTKSANKRLLTQYRHFVDSQRQIKAGSTKTRGEVRGGGAKPWRQKGTGRARHGSSRSPLWVGGGVTFGPLGTHFSSQRLPAKMRRLAFLTLLTDAGQADRLALVDELTGRQLRQKLTDRRQQKRLVLVAADRRQTILRGAANLEKTELVSVNRLGATHLQGTALVVFDRPAWEALCQRYHKST